MKHAVDGIIMKHALPMRLVRFLTVTMSLMVLMPTLQAEPEFVEPKHDWMPTGIDWEKAEKIEILFEDNVFHPDELTLIKDKPYIMRLKNIGNRGHDMADQEFFHSIVTKKIHSSDGSIETPHIHSLYLKPKKEYEVQLVPKLSGTYEFICTIPGHREDGMEGTIIIR